MNNEALLEIYEEVKDYLENAVIELKDCKKLEDVKNLVEDAMSELENVTEEARKERDIAWEQEQDEINSEYIKGAI